MLSFINDLQTRIQSDRMDDLLQPGHDACFFIYGSGSVALAVQQALQRRGLSILGLLDHLGHGTGEINGLPRLRPDDPGISLRRRAVVILGIHNHLANVPLIIERLHSLQYGRVVTLIQLYDYLGDELGDRYWLTKRSRYADFLPQIEQADALWADEASCSLYYAVLRFRLVGDYTLLPPPNASSQYFPADIPPWPVPLHLVDCGAYDGDVVRGCVETGRIIDAYAGFEPDPVNFTHLTRYIFPQEGPRLSQAMLWPCGVHHSTHQLAFCSDQGSASALSPAGSSIIQCVALDDALPGFRPTLIKMDIEGAEADALRGARRLIQTYHPGLAICVYHKPDDLWRIPLLIEEIANPVGDPADRPYHYYLRSHSLNGFEMVCYAVPK